MLRTAAFLAVFAIAFALCMRADFVSLLTWEWLSVMKPQSEAWGSGVLNYQNMIAGILTVIAVFTARDRKPPAFNIFTFLLVLFTAMITLSQIFSLNSDISASQFNIAIELIFMCLAILVLANTKVKIQAVIWILVISVGYYSVTGGLRTIASGGVSIIFGPAGSLLEDNNHLAVGVASMVPLAFYLFRTSADVRARVVAAGIGALAILTVFGTHSRGGLISLGVLYLGMVARTKRKFISVLFLAVVGGGALLIMPGQWFSRMSSLSSQVSEKEAESSFNGRVEAWEVAYKMALQHPILGTGARVHYYPAYNYKVAPVNSTTGVPYFYRATHNAYLEILAGNGFIAIGAFLGMMITAFFWCGAIKRQTNKLPGFLWANDLAAMLQVSLLVYAVGTMAVSMEYWIGLWIVMVLIVNLREMVMREAKAPLRPRRGGVV